MAGVLRDVHYNGLPTTKEELVRCTSFGNKLELLPQQKQVL